MDSRSRSLRAHRVILSACSSFFKTMLREQATHYNSPNPYIFLKGVSYNDLSLLLDFMYHGQVNISQEDLNSFLAVAEDLKIKGLSDRINSGISEKSDVAKPQTSRKKASDNLDRLRVDYNKRPKLYNYAASSSKVQISPLSQYRENGTNKKRSNLVKDTRHQNVEEWTGPGTQILYNEEEEIDQGMIYFCKPRTLINLYKPPLVTSIIYIVQ